MSAPGGRRERGRRRGGRRVPLVLQEGPSDCAAACLAMVLRFHGVPAGRSRLVDCRELCGDGRDGATARALARAARRAGLRVRSFSSPSADLGALEPPFVVHWDFRHFLVVERYGPKGVQVADPARGRRLVSPEEWSESFTGVVLCFEPGVRLEGAAGRRSTFSWRGYLRELLTLPGLRASLGWILCASLLLQALGLALPVFTKLIVDHLLPAGRPDLLLMLGLGAGLWAVSQALASYLRSSFLLHLQARVDLRVMLGFFEHLLSLPLRFFQRRTTGDLLARLSSNLMLREILTNQTTAIVLDGALVVGYLAVLFAWSPTFGFLAAGLGALQVALLVATTPALHRWLRRDLEAQAASQGYLVQVLSAVAMLKATGGEGAALQRWSDLFRRQLEVTVRRGRIAAVVGSLQGALQLLSPLVMLLVGAYLILEQGLSLGSMLALQALAAAFLTPLSSLVASGQGLQMMGAHMERLGDVFEAEPEIAAVGPGERRRVLPGGPGRIELEGVSFRYERDGPPALEDVSLVVEPGSKVAIVGPSGSGKTTLGLLLLGLHPPGAGTIRYDGALLQELDLVALRRRFGVVLQESHLFSGTVRENIAFLEPTLPLEEVREAARAAAIDEELEALPLGYDTILSEGGGGLSGGQRQRLSIARALAHRPSLLLLDEATSHLDALSEARVEERLAERGLTRVVIAHRLSTVANADAIVVLERGRVVARGTHAELLAAGGLYAELVAAHAEQG